MKASKFSDAQKAFILKQGAEGMPVAENRHSVAMPTGHLQKPRASADGGALRRTRRQWGRFRDTHPADGAAPAVVVAGLLACRYAGTALLLSQTNRFML